MIVTFCGHAQFNGTNEYEQKVLAVLEKTVGDNIAYMYLGGYGGFDSFAYDCCLKYKKLHPNVFLVFISPYLTIQYQRNQLKSNESLYDFIIYPELENKPPRFAIVYRNKWMVDAADLVISGINHQWGGAYKTFAYAKRKGKPIFNIFD